MLTINPRLLGSLANGAYVKKGLGNDSYIYEALSGRQVLVRSGIRMDRQRSAQGRCAWSDGQCVGRDSSDAHLNHQRRLGKAKLAARQSSFPKDPLFFQCVPSMRANILAGGQPCWCSTLVLNLDVEGNFFGPHK